jgi:hypothetical protein
VCGRFHLPQSKGWTAAQLLQVTQTGLLQRGAQHQFLRRYGMQMQRFERRADNQRPYLPNV